MIVEKSLSDLKKCCFQKVGDGFVFIFYYPSLIPYLNNFNIKHHIILYPDYLISYM